MRARIRSVKPDVLTDEDLWDLEERTKLPIFRVFQGLWMYGDREGRFEWRLRVLAPLILPFAPERFHDTIAALAEAKFVVRYEVDGSEYGLVRSFKKHQVINNREELSTLPPPPKDVSLTRSPRVLSGVGTRASASEPREEARVPHATSGEGKGMEGRGSTRDARDPPDLPNGPTTREVPSQALIVELREAVGAEYFRRDAQGQRAGDGQWVDGADRVLESLRKKRFPNAATAITALAKAVVDASLAPGGKLGHALRDAEFGPPPGAGSGPEDLRPQLSPKGAA